MLDSLISRRQFLRLVVFFIFFLIVGITRIFFSSGRSISLLSNFASGQTTGSWQTGPSTSAIPINAALLLNGDIFYLTGSGYNLNSQFGPYIARIYNPYTGAESSVSLGEDLFCAGNTQLSNGNILLAGGTSSTISRQTTATDTGMGQILLTSLM